MIVAEKRYYTTAEVMQILNIKPGNYSTLGVVCRKHRLPRLKIGKDLMFPVKLFDARLAAIEQAGIKNFNI